MKRNKFLIGYTICVVLFYALAYLVISLNSNDKVEPDAALFTNVTTPVLALSDVPVPECSAEAAVVLDAQSGALLYAKNADKILPMASTTKIMTAKIILEAMPLDKTVTVPKEATLVEGSSIYLQENEEITVETLLYGLLLESGNDAATTLAIACSGSEAEFVKLMNQTSENMGLKSTVFANPHGLSADNHYTTAYELAYITMCAMKNPKFCEIIGTKKYIAPSADGSYTRYFFNHNKLLNTYDGANGVKTGYTIASGRCLVSSAQRDNEKYICVTLNDRNDWHDHKTLLDYAFANYDCIEIAHPESFALSYGKTRYICTEPVYLTVSAGEKPSVSYRITTDGTSAKTDYFSDGAKLGTFMMHAN